MSEEKTEQNGQTEQTEQKKENTQTPIWVQILIALIGATAIIIGAYIGTQALKTQEVKVILINMKTKEVISGKVFIDAGQEGFPGTPDSPALIKLKKGNRLIRAESENYEPAFVPTENIASTVTIEMKKIPVASEESVDDPVPLSLTGWNVWNEITLRRGTGINEVIVNGSPADAAGFNSTTVTTALRGRTLVLDFSNTQMSRFGLDKMVKLTYNRNNLLLLPDNASLLGDYLPAGDTPTNQGIEYPIPEDFDGKLEFTFYQADITDLKITAYYK